MRMKVYHSGFEKIERPDLKKGRKNADFGQGFYLSDDKDFSLRWAKKRRGSISVINTYELNLDGLKVKTFQRDAEWFSFIFANRNGYEDGMADDDVIIGPIANDTLFDTFGIITSGILKKEQALKLLQAGPTYRQIVIRSGKALDQLSFMSCEVIDEKDLDVYHGLVLEEERKFQESFAEKLAGFDD